MLRIKTIIMALLVTQIFTGCATDTTEVANYSGYIGDYDKLEKILDERGDEVLRWQSSDLIPGAYDKIMIDPVVFYPEGEATPQVSAQLQTEVRDYASSALKREVGKGVTLTSQPGPSVLRMRVAITGISTAAEGLKGYEYIPIAAIVAGVSSASGERDRETFILTEAELLDSTTGERLFIQVYKAKGEILLENDEEQVTLDTVRDMFDAGVERTRLLLEHLTVM